MCISEILVCLIVAVNNIGHQRDQSDKVRVGSSLLHTGQGESPGVGRLCADSVRHRKRHSEATWLRVQVRSCLMLLTVPELPATAETGVFCMVIVN